MQRLQIISVFISIIAGACRAQVQNANFNPNGMLNRQGAGGISFAIPGLSLLAGGNGAGGNFFGPRTFTRTLVSTVSTVTTQSFRTCTTVPAGLMPCVAGAGRRRRNARLDEEKLYEIQATPSVQLIIGSTTITDPFAVTEYLEAHKPSSQSVIYPPGVDFSENDKVKMNPRLGAVIGETTVLYPSQDTPETTASFLEEETFADDFGVTTETPSFQDEQSSDLGGTTLNPELEVEGDEKARVGFGGTTTVTTIIRVTSVATTLATGPSATLTVMYTGCSPNVFPVSGLACV